MLRSLNSKVQEQKNKGRLHKIIDTLKRKGSPSLVMKKNRGHFTIFCFVLCFTVLSIYWQVFNNQFINFDDNVYVYENTKVQNGLTADGIIWAFTSAHASNWHPVTWLSHMIDTQFFGSKAGAHHLVSVFFHLLNSLLLFLFLHRTTQNIWASIFASLLFAVHPLHVESVAWTSERKDLLSTFFMLLTLLSYLYYSRQPSLWNYCAVVLFFLLSLLSKPMLVTLPILLLLLDSWPLGRIRPVATLMLQEQKSEAMYPKTISFLIYEKIPLFVLAGASCLATFIVQQHSGAVKSVQMMQVTLRIANAFVSYVRYLKKMIFPLDLAIIYPYPETIPLWMSGGAALVLLAISVAVLGVRRKHPYLVVGWFWYLFAMIPVIGLVQVGVQSMADRYTYTPLIGIFIMISFGYSALNKVPIRITWPLATISIFALAVLSWRQVGFWRNSELLFTHALEVTDNNYTAHNCLAGALAENGNHLGAEQHYTAALSIKPNYFEAMANLGVVLAEQGKMEQAFAYLSKAAQMDPKNAKTQNNLGNIYKSRNQLEEAVGYYKKALLSDPENKEALFNLADTLEKQGFLKESIMIYYKTVKLYPVFAEAWNGLGVVLARNGNRKEATDYFRRAVKLKPNYRQAEKNLAIAVSL